MREPQSIETRIGTLEFTHDFANGYPTEETVQKLFNELDFQRACQVYLWGLPLVSFAQWQHGHKKTCGANSGDIVVYDTYQEKLSILTANMTTPYAISFIELDKKGPMVIEIQGDDHNKGILCGTNSMWQIEIASLKEPGKYLFVAPGADTPSTTEGYQVYQSPTNSIFLGARLTSNDEDEWRPQLEKVQIYPYSESDSHEDTKIIDLKDQSWDGYQPRGIAYFERLAEILSREPVAERDRFFMAMLKPLGIEKGRPFAPNQQQTALLEEAALVGEAMAKANDFDKTRLEAAHYADGSHWEVATVCPPDQRYEHYESLDGRAAWSYEAVINDPLMHSPEDEDTTTEGYVYEGQIYLASYRDSNGDWLDGANNYRLHVLPNVPIANFWSITVYDVATRCLIDNDQEIADKSSRMDYLLENADGSIDIYIGPDAPTEEEKLDNWIPTVAGKAWFAYFRFYSPTGAYFDQSWILPDIEKV